jgi:hypothetical protein
MKLDTVLRDDRNVIVTLDRGVDIPPCPSIAEMLHHLLERMNAVDGDYTYLIKGRMNEQPQSTIHPYKATVDIDLRGKIQLNLRVGVHPDAQVGGTLLPGREAQRDASFANRLRKAVSELNEEHWTSLPHRENGVTMNGSSDEGKGHDPHAGAGTRASSEAQYTAFLLDVARTVMHPNGTFIANSDLFEIVYKHFPDRPRRGLYISVLSAIRDGFDWIHKPIKDRESPVWQISPEFLAKHGMKVTSAPSSPAPAPQKRETVTGHANGVAHEAGGTNGVRSEREVSPTTQPDTVDGRIKTLCDLTKRQEALRAEQARITNELTSVTTELTQLRASLTREELLAFVLKQVSGA